MCMRLRRRTINLPISPRLASYEVDFCILCSCGMSGRFLLNIRMKKYFSVSAKRKRNLFSWLCYFIALCGRNIYILSLSSLPHNISHFTEKENSVAKAEIQFFVWNLHCTESKNRLQRLYGATHHINIRMHFTQFAARPQEESSEFWARSEITRSLLIVLNSLETTAAHDRCNHHWLHIDDWRIWYFSLLLSYSSPEGQANGLALFCMKSIVSCE